MAEPERTGMRQAYLKQSFMRSRTIAICDCGPGPGGVFTACFGKTCPLTNTRISRPIAISETDKRRHSQQQNHRNGKTGRHYGRRSLP
jgi:hypothetical protein